MRYYFQHDGQHRLNFLLAASWQHSDNLTLLAKAVLTDENGAVARAEFGQFVKQRITNVCDIHTVTFVEFLLERQDNQHFIH